MTWPWPISFKRPYLLPFVLLPAQLIAGILTGRVQLTDSKDAAVNKQSDFSGVAVWLESVDDAAPLPVGKHLRMLQKEKKFTPHILVASTGTSVDFPNLDPIFHNAFSNFEGKIFDVGLYSPGSSRSVRFNRPGIVHVFCNIHPSMSAIIVVVNTPYFSTTDRSGHFSITNVPPGSYRLHFFHERATAETLEALTRIVSIGSQATELRVVEISETGYLPVGHKNKYGREYPKESEEGQTYESPLK